MSTCTVQALSNAAITITDLWLVAVVRRAVYPHYGNILDNRHGGTQEVVP